MPPQPTHRRHQGGCVPPSHECVVEGVATLRRTRTAHRAPLPPAEAASRTPEAAPALHHHVWSHHRRCQRRWSSLLWRHPWRQWLASQGRAAPGSRRLRGGAAGRRGPSRLRHSAPDPAGSGHLRRSCGNPECALTVDAGARVGAQDRTAWAVATRAVALAAATSRSPRPPRPLRPPVLGRSPRLGRQPAGGQQSHPQEP